jgi:hypothetical protein
VSVAHRLPLLLSAVAALVSAGCGSSTPTSSTGAGPGVTSPRASPQVWNGAVVLGRAGQTSGKVSSQSRFAPKDLIELRVDAGGAAPDTEVSATWLDDHGRVLGSEVHRSQGVQGTMVFASPSPGGLQPGGYRVQVRVNGQLVSERHFEVQPQRSQSPQRKPDSSPRQDQKSRASLPQTLEALHTANPTADLLENPPNRA